MAQLYLLSFNKNCLLIKKKKKLIYSLGKEITLKQEEQRPPNARRFQRRNRGDNRRFFRYRGRGRSFTDTNTKRNDEENVEDAQNKRSRRKYRKSKVLLLLIKHKIQILLFCCFFELLELSNSYRW